MTQTSDKQSNKLQQRIDRVESRLAQLKSQAAARADADKARWRRAARAKRTRALLLFGVALEADVKSESGAAEVMRELISKHLKRENERAAALEFLDSIEPKDPQK